MSVQLSYISPFHRFVVSALFSLRVAGLQTCGHQNNTLLDMSDTSPRVLCQIKSATTQETCSGMAKMLVSQSHALHHSFYRPLHPDVSSCI
ncbi:hypothetical protein DEU56DRAFT_824641 [Suillus clintonianus]|uniref:uncharacterized protein n=1 Tax=Suillus clintonianus TaxID=1904413 RepID=UPI001B8641DD|nr:uncharacterized protein DEU56DRAFT_824641 [Suillus clintonianus]KAG2125470.1 hypothetical protein DEU56DRAFT_824641 [Suillus clintonianus]